jgi:hypothetical protein
VNFRGSEVLSIKIGGYGFIESDQRQGCNFNTLSLGTSSGEITIKCGEPDLRHTEYETITSKTKNGKLKRAVTIDKWTYNLGPSHFMRILTFRNGEMIDIRTGEKGFK